MISVSAATLIGFTFETLFYGVFLIAFGIAASLQWGRYRRESLTFGNKLVFGFSILLCLFITTHWWLNLWTVYDAFLRMPTPLARDMYLSNLGSKISITKLTLYEIQTWMGDLLLVYRLYYVAGRKWVVLVPSAVMCSTLVVCSCHFLYYASKVDVTHPKTILATLWMVKKWAIATFVVSIAENLYCLALISFFIWKTHRDVRQTTASSLQSVLRIFIESAGMWVLCIIVTFVVYMINVIAAYVPLYLTNPVLGVSFCMMVIRLQLRSNTTTVGSGNSKPQFNFRTASKEHSSYTAGSMGAQSELMVFSSKRTEDTTFDATTSKV